VIKIKDFQHAKNYIFEHYSSSRLFILISENNYIKIKRKEKKELI